MWVKGRLPTTVVDNIVGYLPMEGHLRGRIINDDYMEPQGILVKPKNGVGYTSWVRVGSPIEEWVVGTYEVHLQRLHDQNRLPWHLWRGQPQKHILVMEWRSPSQVILERAGLLKEIRVRGTLLGAVVYRSEGTYFPQEVVDRIMGYVPREVGWLVRPYWRGGERMCRQGGKLEDVEVWAVLAIQQTWFSHERYGRCDCHTIEGRRLQREYTPHGWQLWEWQGSCATLWATRRWMVGNIAAHRP